MMPDREKAIKGLEQFIADFKPFCGNKADWQRVYDAIALLKAQEPKVMTLEEVQKTPYTTPIYCEWREGEVHTALIRPTQKMRVKGYVEMYTDDEDIGLLNYEMHIMDSYGKTWRCWTSRPTDEQREATPWG